MPDLADKPSRGPAEADAKRSIRPEVSRATVEFLPMADEATAEVERGDDVAD